MRHEKLPVYSATQIAEAIALFPPRYHADFATTRALARKWMAGAATPAELAVKLDAALVSWGAGRRKAPALKHQTRDVLSDPTVKAALVEFENLALRDLHSVEQAWYDGRPELLLGALEKLNALFEQNNSVTYPTKALLLLTGNYVGLDSNVRTAIAAAGIPGFRETQFPMPSELTDRNSARLTLVLGLTGAWIREHEGAISAALSTSSTGRKLAELDSPARVLDICLFVHGSGRA